MPPSKDPPHASALRKGRRSIPGRAYFITKNVRNRNTDFLIRPECAQLIIESFKWASTQSWWINLGFVIMPDHYHLNLALGNTKTLSEAIKSVNKFTARRINTLIGRKGKFWQEGFYDHAIRNHGEFDRILAYIHNNPVKVGLVEKPELWPYSTANDRNSQEIDWGWINAEVWRSDDDSPSFDENDLPAEYG